MAEEKGGTPGVHDVANRESGPTQSSASDWDMNRSKPSKSPLDKEDGKEKEPEGLVGGVQDQQNPQLKH
jgi:hypothetical protein